MAFRGIVNNLGGEMLDRAVIGVGVDASGVKRGMAEATRDVKMGAAGWGTAFKAVGAATIGIATGIAGFASAGIKSSIEFNAALGQVYAMTGATREEMAGFREEILKMAGAVGKSPKELAEALYFVKSAGLDGASAMKVLEASAKAAQAGMTDVATVADGVTSVMMAYNMSGDDAYKVTDILTQAVISGKFEWADLAGAIGKVSVYANQAGIPLDELAAAMAAVSQIGLSARDSSFQLISTIRGLNTPTDQQSKIMRELGIVWDENTLKSKGLVGSLQYLQDQLGKQESIIIKNTDGTVNYAKSEKETQRVLGNSNVAWRKLLGNQGAFLVSQLLLQNDAGRFKGIMNDMAGAVGKTNDSFEKMKEFNMGLVWSMMQQQIAAISIRLGDNLLPLMNKFMGWLNNDLPGILTNLGDFWNTYLSKPIDHLLDGIGAVIGAFANVFGSLMSGKGTADGMAKVWDGIASSLGKVVDYLGTVLDLFAKLLGNTFVQRIIQVAAAFTAIRLAVSGVRAGAGAFGRLMGSTGKFFASPFGGGGGAGSASDPAAQMNNAAQMHKQAAGDLRGAARALSGAARGGGLGGKPVASPIDPRYYTHPPTTYDPVLGGDTPGGGPYRTAHQIPNTLNYVDSERQHESTMRQGMAWPIDYKQLPAVDRQAVRDRYNSTLAGLKQAEQDSNTFQQQMRRTVATMGGGITNVAKAMSGAIRAGGGVLAQADKLDVAARNVVQSYFGRMGNAVLDTLRGGRSGGGVGQILARSGAAFQSIASKAFTPLIEGVMSGISTSLSAAQRGGALARTLNQRASMIGPGLVNAITMSVGNAMSGLGSVRLPTFAKMQQAASIAARKMADRVNDGLFNGLRSLPSAYGGYRKMVIAGQDAAHSLLSTAGNAFVGGMTRLGNATMAFPGRAVSGLKGAMSGLMSAFLGQRVFQPALDAAGEAIKNSAGQEVGQMVRRGGVMGAAGKVAGFVGKAFWPIMIGSMVADLAAAPIGDFVSSALGKKNLGAELKANLFGGIATWATAALNGVDVELIANLPHSEFTFGNTKVTALQAAKMNFSRAAITEAFADNVTLAGEVSQLHMAKLALDQTLKPVLNIDEGAFANLDFSAQVVDNPRATLAGRGAASKAFVDTIQNLIKTYAAQLGNKDLPALIQEAVQSDAMTGSLPDDTRGTLNDPKTRQFVIDRIKEAAGADYRFAMVQLRQAVRAGLEQTIDDPALLGKVAPLLTDSELESYAYLLSNNINGQFTPIIQMLLDQTLAKVSGHTPTITPPTPATGGGKLQPGFPGEAPPSTADMTAPQTLLKTQLQVAQDRITTLLSTSEGKQAFDQMIGLLKTKFAGVPAALDNPALRAAVIKAVLPGADTSTKEAIADNWTEVMKRYATLIYATGSGDITAIGQGWARVVKQWLASGFDLSRLDGYAEFKTYLGDLVRNGQASPELAALYSQMLSGSLSQGGHDAIEAGKTSMSDFLTTIIESLKDGTPAQKKLAIALQGALSAALRSTATTDYPDAGAAAEGLMSAFINSIPDSEGATRTELRTVFLKAIADAKKDADPTARTNGQAFLKAFIDGLPDKYADLKTMLTGLLTNAPADASKDPKPQAAAQKAGGDTMLGVNKGIAASPKTGPGSLSNAISTAFLAGLPVLSPDSGIALTLKAMGISLIDWIAKGVPLGAPALHKAVRGVLTGFTASGDLPHSPVRSGPLKHPFLPNIGKKIVEQISEGIAASSLIAPSMAFKPAGLSGAFGSQAAGVGGMQQNLHVDKMILTDKQLRNSEVERLQFLMPRNR